MQTLGKTLKQLRTNAGLSQREVAKALGYKTPQLISNNERNISHPPMNSIRKLAKLYAVDADSLFSLILDDILKRETDKFNRKWRRCK